MCTGAFFLYILWAVIWTKPVFRVTEAPMRVAPLVVVDEAGASLEAAAAVEVEVEVEAVVVVDADGVREYSESDTRDAHACAFVSCLCCSSAAALLWIMAFAKYKHRDENIAFTVGMGLGIPVLGAAFAWACIGSRTSGLKRVSVVTVASVMEVYLYTYGIWLIADDAHVYGLWIALGHAIFVCVGHRVSRSRWCICRFAYISVALMACMMILWVGSTHPPFGIPGYELGTGLVVVYVMHIMTPWFASLTRSDFPSYLVGSDLFSSAVPVEFLWPLCLLATTTLFYVILYH